ncbi:glycosyltransferase family 2 protein [Parasulfitobacter algicola]|uniref:Glycosyltransferase family 2 protein n=1 Tax=Parasulfitobacter algicola TaxID=2614809 RepID=A0ABX2IPM9_9RHOB|nr:glycosyltransferase family 2 protein [Sulfitobacter algicola]NSX54320.1 glycosyltransferase family 2 protein [Sulfitobacter algicola]
MDISDIFHHRLLGTQRIAGHLCLDAVQVGDQAHVYFAAGVPMQLFQGGDVASVMNGPVIVGPPGVLRVGDAPLLPRYSELEHDLFAGLNVGLTVNNGFDAKIIADWVRYHVEHHNMQAVCLINRVVPDEDIAAYFDQLKLQLQNIGGLQRFLLLEVTAPLGHTDLPAETHPFNAPDAPGKDRMQVPEGDAFRSPLKEGLVYDIAKLRFLAEAAAVMIIEPYDYLPLGGADVFQAAMQDGFVMLHGTRIFPWRVRQNDDLQFADHICKRFDDQSFSRKWCVAPKQVGLENNWRFVRISNVKAKRALPFYRCMQLRHPGSAVSDIVPKSSLAEDDALLASAAKFHRKPIRQPKSDVQIAEGPAADAGYTVIVTTMKNEGPFILEWLAFHRAIGVKEFLVYTNDCTDGTDDLLKLLDAKGFVQHRENPFRTMDLRPQHAALQAAENEKVVQDAGWVVCMDVDEFINIHVGDGTLNDLYQAVGDANMISMTWRLFGNADVDKFEPSFVIKQFQQCAPQVIRKPHQAWGFKTLFRNNGLYKKLGVHRPKGLKPDLWDQIKWVNGSGKPMPDKMFRNGWRSSISTYGYDLVTLNHYAVRSAESFLVKRDRGRVNHVDRDQGMNYWFRMNNNAETDRTILRLLPKVQVEYDAFLADPDIAALNNICITHHHAKISELKLRDDYAKFYKELTSPRSQTLSRLHHHFGSNVFLAGPAVIPDDIIKQELPKDFFFTVPRQE